MIKLIKAWSVHDKAPTAETTALQYGKSMPIYDILDSEAFSLYRIVVMLDGDEMYTNGGFFSSSNICYFQLIFVFIRPVNYVKISFSDQSPLNFLQFTAIFV